MIAVVDYGMSNLRSIRRGLEVAGGDVRVIDDPRELAHARGIVLPGDGAFGQTMQNLEAGGWIAPLLQAVQQRGVPFLGICLGMQLLFETSEELGLHRGLGILRGGVRKFQHGKVPQIGWNQLETRGQPRSLQGIPDGSFAYFVHSYYCAPDDPAVVAATTDYHGAYASVVERGSIWGAQFHPEKSHTAGLHMLRNFVQLVG